MLSRTRRSTIIFAKAFRLKSEDGALPAGVRAFDTREEPIARLSFLA